MTLFYYKESIFFICKRCTFFKIKNCLFVAVKLTRHAVKRIFVNNGYGIIIDGSDSWSFPYELVKMLYFLNIDSILSRHFKNHRNNFLILSERLPDDINEIF